MKSTNSDGDRALRETQYLMNRIQSTSGLWERLCDATNEGKPKCLSAIINIAREAGIIETDTETALLSDEEPVTIYSEHHEAASHLVLSSEDSARLCVIAWALEGKRLKR